MGWVRGRPPSDALLAALAGLVALAVYLRTLYPGLNGIGDTPKFQFVGAVLGTPHPPGYPFYTLLSWLFSKLPLGNLAWRINLLSSVAAASAVAFLVLLLRRLDCRRSVAFATALAFGFGRVLWSQATLAEVYAPAAALLAGLLAALVAWGRSRRPLALDAAVLLAALNMAHHVSVATVVPALVLYVLLTDARAGLAPRFLLRGALLVLAGLSPYLLILLRNWQHAPYLGARASSLVELLRVIRGASFEGRLFAFGPRELAAERVPLVGRLLAQELGSAGLVLALLGIVVLLRTRRREALLLGVGALGVLGFVLNYDVPDLEVFLVPAFVLVWPFAAAGLEAVLRAARTLPAVAAMALALALPLRQLGANFRGSDHSDRTFEMRYFRELFAALPARAAIAAESYTVDHMVLYELLGEKAARGRDVATIPGDAESVRLAAERGYTVFAFGRTAEALASLGFPLTPVRLLGAPLDEYLRTLPRGRTAARAGLRGGVRLAAVGETGKPPAARQGAEAVVEASSPAPIRADSRPDGASILVRGVLAARSEDGVALAVLGAGGRVLESHDLDPAEGLRVPFTARAFPLYRLLGPPDCVEVGGGAWTEVGGAAGGGRLLLRLDDHDRYDARMTLYLRSARPLEPRVARIQGAGTPQLEVLRLEGRELAAALRADGLEAPGPALTRVDLSVNDEGQFSALTLDLGGLAQGAWARADVDLKHPRRALVCALPPGNADLFAAARRETIGFSREGAPFLGAGWHAPEGEGYRWSAAAEAELLLPFASAAATRVRLRAMPLPAAEPGEIGLDVNGAFYEARPLRQGWAAYEWAVPAGAWHAGVNRIAVRVPRAASPKSLGLGDDERSLGIAVSYLVLRRD